MLSLLLNYRLICHLIPPDQVSIYVVALGIVGLGSLICGSGLGSVLLRRMSWARQSDAEPNHKPLLLRVLGLATIAWFVVSACLVLLLTLYPDFFRRPILPLVWLLILWIAARCFLSLVTEAIRGLQIFWLAALSGGQQEGPLVNLIITTLLIVGADQIVDIRQVLVVHVGATAAVAVFTLLMMRRTAQFSAKSVAAKATPTSTDSTPVRLNQDRSLLSESLIVLVSQMSVFGLVEFETLLIGRYCDDSQVGAWGAIRRLITVVSAPLLLINAAIPGFIAELHSQGEKAKLEKILRAASTLATPPAFVAFVGLFFFGDRVLAMFEPGFAIAWSSLALLAAANIVFVGAGSAGLTLRMTDNQGRTIISAVLLAVAYLAIAPWVIDHYKLWGAAVLGSVLIVSRNVISTIFVRLFIGIWCTPSFRLAEVRQLWQALRSQRRTKQKQDAGMVQP